jgi:predicted GNAT family acetyltransferase
MSGIDVDIWQAFTRSVRQDFVVRRFVSQSADIVKKPILNRETHSMTASVQDNPAKGRYELDVEGHIAATYYELADGVVTFTHTEVPKELGGRGIGSQLVKDALEQVRAKGLKVVAQCPFVKGYIDKHADYADLLK